MPASRTDVIVALGAPAAVVALDVATGVYDEDLSKGFYSGYDGVSRFASLTVAKVATLAWTVGRAVSSGWLRTIVFVWCVALIDLGLFAQFLQGDEQMLVAVTLAELGLLLCWATLADVRWVWRLPIGLLALASILPLGTIGLGDSRVWMPLLTLGLGFQLVVYFALRWRRYRIAADYDAQQEGSDSPTARHSQFGVKHLLVWSAALPPLLVVIRLIDWRLGWWLKGFGASVAELPDALTLGAAIAAGSLAVVAAVLGSGPWWARLVVATGITAAIHWALLWWSAARMSSLPVGAWFRRGNTVEGILLDMKAWWTPWCLLAFGLLAALLLFLRASGYRLRRQR